MPMAFTTLGHGSENSYYKKVPPGCILVVAANSGNSMLASKGDPMQIKLMDINNRKYILDPLNYQREIFDLFGPVTIFKPGDYYPEYTYHLLEYMPPRKFVMEDNNGEPVLRSFPTKVSVSGLIGIESVHPVDPHLVDSVMSRLMFDAGLPNMPNNAVIPQELPDEMYNMPLLLVGGKVPNIAKIIKTVPSAVAKATLDDISELNPEALKIIEELDFPNFFRYSSLPSMDWVNATLTDFLRRFETPKQRTIIDSTYTIKSVFEYLGKKSLISQQELFATGGSGVYYNFVCRVRENSPRAAIKQRISEAEGQRKSLVRAKFTSGGKLATTGKLANTGKLATRRRRTTKRKDATN